MDKRLEGVKGVGLSVQASGCRVKGSGDESVLSGFRP